MAKEQTWRFAVDGAEHTVTYTQPGFRSGGGVLSIDGGEGRSVFSLDGYLDEPVDVDGKACRFVLRNYTPDLAVDGVFLNSGKPYAPNEPIPSWVRTFTAMTILGLFILMPSIPVGAIAGLAVWRGGEFIAQRSGVPKKKKVTQYLGFLALAWLIAVVIFFVWGD